MRIEFTLNDKIEVVDVPPEKRLLSILKEEFSLTRNHGNCLQGECGACSVLFNGELAAACLIPAFMVRNAQVTTIEGFAKTREYAAITRGFREAGCFPCDFCIAGKILSVHSFLESHGTFTDQDIVDYLEGSRCNCTSQGALIRGVKKAHSYRRKKRNVR